jgi:hypothetical protein
MYLSYRVITFIRKENKLQDERLKKIQYELKHPPIYEDAKIKFIDYLKELNIYELVKKEDNINRLDDPYFYTISPH